MRIFALLAIALTIYSANDDSKIKTKVDINIRQLKPNQANVEQHPISRYYMNTRKGLYYFPFRVRYMIA